MILLENWVQNGLKKQTTVKHDNVNIRSNNERDLQKDAAETINVRCSKVFLST